MKEKILLILIASCFILPNVSFASFDQNLWYGSKGDKVKELQEFLSTEGCFNYSIFTGNFFSITVNAVKCFQTKYGITPIAGYFGPKTRTKANEILANNLQAGEQEATSNTNTSSFSATTTTSNAIPSLQDQINALLAQLQELNAKISAQTTVQQQNQQSTQQIQQSVQQIQQNTASTTQTPVILSVNVIPSLTSAVIEWQTDIPTNAKVFLSGGSFSLQVFASESDLSTHHVVHLSSLTSNTLYSYDIEVLAGSQLMKKQGTFTTKPDEYNISIQADKTSVQLTNWNSVTITVQVAKNGVLAPLAITFTTPDGSKTYNVIANDFKPSPTGTIPCGNQPFLIQLSGTTGGTCSSDAKVSFNYLPKSLGTHTITISANG